MPGIFFDSSAILAWYKQQSNCEVVEEYLKKVSRDLLPGYVCEVNLVEVLYQIGRYEKNFDLAKEFVEDLLIHTGLEQIAANWKTLEQAAKYKMNGNIALPDCVLLATAKAHHGSIITSDPEFRPYTKEVEFVWI